MNSLHYQQSFMFSSENMLIINVSDVHEHIKGIHLHLPIFFISSES